MTKESTVTGYSAAQLQLAKKIYKLNQLVLFPSLVLLVLGAATAFMPIENRSTLPLLFLVMAGLGLMYSALEFFGFKKSEDFLKAKQALINDKLTVKELISNEKSVLKGELAAVKTAKRAESELKSVQRTHAGNIQNLENELLALNDEKGKRVMSLGGVTLYERHITSPQGSGSIIGLHATAEDNTSISKRITATRMLAFGVFSLAVPKKKGIGHAYVVFDGPDISGVATIQGTQNQAAGPQAAAFAAAINNQARKAAEWQESRPQEDAKLRTAIKTLKSQDVGVAEELAFEAAFALVSDDMKRKHFEK